MFTRKEYMDQYKAGAEGMILHRKYYAQFVSKNTIACVANFIGKDALLNSKDKHFNDIPLAKWDRLAGMLPPMAAKIKDAGDYWTLTGLVCVAKEAARQYVEIVKGE